MEEKIWIQKAETDLKTAKNSFKSGDYYASAFWSQQSVEKALKAVHIFNSDKLIRTHDLSNLGRLVNLPKDLLEKAILLIPFYTSSRYPISGIEETSDKENVKEALIYAEEILKWCQQKIKT